MNMMLWALPLNLTWVFYACSSPKSFTWKLTPEREWTFASQSLAIISIHLTSIQKRSTQQQQWWTWHHTKPFSFALGRLLINWSLKPVQSSLTWGSEQRHNRPSDTGGVNKKHKIGKMSLICMIRSQISWGKTKHSQAGGTLNSRKQMMVSSQSWRQREHIQRLKYLDWSHCLQQRT